MNELKERRKGKEKKEKEKTGGKWRKISSGILVDSNIEGEKKNIDRADGFRLISIK